MTVQGNQSSVHPFLKILFQNVCNIYSSEEQAICQNQIKLKKTALCIMSYAALESRQNNNKYILNYSRIPLTLSLPN
jgi:hypothetical protein